MNSGIRGGRSKEDQPPLSHLDSRGHARMVDVSQKPSTVREAVARASVKLQKETLKLIRQGAMPKGDVQAVARIAGVMAAKKTPEIIPLCHPIAITSAHLDVWIDEAEGHVGIEAVVKTSGQTGVEMEALTAAAAAALAVYDMCKAVDRGAVISEIKLMSKKGGKSGVYKRKA